MKTATVADLQNNFGQVSSWIESGETVQILKEGQPFAQLAAAVSRANVRKPTVEEHMAWLREVWGDRCFTDDEVREMREAEREDDWG